MAESKKKALFVTAPLVIAKRPDGSDAYFYQGSPFSEDGLAEGEAARLADFLGSQDELVEASTDASTSASK